MPSTVASTDAEFARALELWERNDVTACEATLRELLARAPAHAGARMLLAQLLQTQGRLDAASALVFDGCRLLGFDAAASARGAEFIRQCHRQQLADALCEATIARHAVPATFLVLAGHIAREVGDFARARTRYLAALDAGIGMDAGFVLGALAHTLRYDDASHPDLARLLAGVRRTDLPPRARAAAAFGLAKGYDDIGDHAAAARVLREANALVRAAQPWSTAGWRDFVAQRKRERIAHARAGPTNFIPVFVLGLPRSGTTLTATQLARHPQARDRGELRALRFIAGELIGGNHLGDAGAIEEGAVLYGTQSRQDDAPATWYIDQDPLNFRYLHIIAAMFPQAHIVLCRRERRDTALSLWSQDFAHADCAFAYDFAGIADYMAGFDELIAHWQQTLPIPIHVSDYEDFVADPTGALARLRELIGMRAAQGWTGGPSTPINSSSLWQARQPIYTRSVGRWRAYAPFVPELDRLPTP